MGQTVSSRGGSAGSSTQFRNASLFVDHHQCRLDLSDQQRDYTSDIPDDCLALIFQFLSVRDRSRCSLVCRRWLSVEGQSRNRLVLNASNDIVPHLPALFNRFDSIIKLALRCERKSVSLNDDALDLIFLRCPNLTNLKIRGCREISDLGMFSLAKNCKSLRKFSSGSCTFGAKGMNALLNNCSSLEEISVKRLRGINDGFAVEPITPGAASASLKAIRLKELYNGQCFSSLIIGSKNLRTLKILRCLGDWDGLLQVIAEGDNLLTEIHLERLQVSDLGLMAISKCPNLETFHLVKAPDCSDAGISAIAENCKLLRKLHIDGWRTNRVGDIGLAAIASNSVHLVELVLIGVNPSIESLSAIASNCQKLERLALCGSETIGDTEVSCIAAKCLTLKKLCIKCCRITDNSIEALAIGCPNLVKLKIKKCRGVSNGAARGLRKMRATLDVALDTDVVEFDSPAAMEAISSEAAAPNDGATVTAELDIDPSLPQSSNRPRRGLFVGRGIGACACSSTSNRNGDSNEDVREF
ncbi:F-box protein SKIP2-like [Andrographis paniculata]|uniref:F-box protein SKIP2-like n=1 Tax=Andrographis paniculata TaxID=175694 RepID=UPI0021E706C0|nr:F-box protein SKIP2-like [Andrographis paniculata]